MFFRLIIILLFVCMNALGAEAKEILVIPGTGDSQSLVLALSEDFNKANPGIEVVIPESIGSSGGIKAVAMGKAQIARVARHIKKREEKYNLHYIQFASCPVVFVINPNIQGVKAVSSAQIVDLYSERINNWQTLGGGDNKIYLVNRERGDSSRSLIEKNIAGFSKIKQLAGKTIYSTPEAVATILAHENTMGYAPAAMIRASGLVSLVLDGVDPNNSETLDQYSMLIPFGLVWQKELSGAAAKFKQYLFTNAARRIIESFGAAPVLMQGD